ncbi:hypothetical protein DRE_04142 [Drechslerella stenobrocha 248]|uniref:BTB domain-containing protein n=1 Tax=Drechslerella stenobrocha 248 TaxID=1043628 RepID=W7IC39_9PEZI|nr:hypothetical protein DRE_04142 [Drechslerella stenobrocha 248]
MENLEEFKDQENIPPNLSRRGSNAGSCSDTDSAKTETPRQSIAFQEYIRTLIIVAKDTTNSRNPTRILNDKALSDIKVFVGESETLFELHRSVIASSSEFFRLIFTGVFRESLTGEVRVPTVEPEAFAIIVNWMYGYGLKLDECTLSAINGAYIGADYLQIATLQSEIYRQVLSNIPWARGDPPKGFSGRIPTVPIRKPLPDIGRPPRLPSQRLPADLGAYADRKLLKSHAESMAKEGMFSNQTAKDFVVDPMSFSLFLAVAMRRHERSLNRITCNMCQSMLEKDQKANFEMCIICGESVPRKKFLDRVRAIEAGLVAESTNSGGGAHRKSSADVDSDCWGTRFRRL